MCMVGLRLLRILGGHDNMGIAKIEERIRCVKKLNVDVFGNPIIGRACDDINHWGGCNGCSDYEKCYNDT
jgi:hypothetical protein